MAARAEAHVNVRAIERNCGRLRRELGDATALCAVVKADGYGHGSLESAQAALRGGAGGLAVATLDEAVLLRTAGIEAPVLMMGALHDSEIGAAARAGVDLVAWREDFVRRIAAEGEDVRLHVKLDTGMGRLGTRDADEAR